MEGELLFRVLLFVLLLAFSAVFSASEVALFSLPRPRVQTMRQEGGVGRLVADLLDRPRRLITSILIGNEIVNIAASALFAGGLVLVLGPERSWLAPILMTPILMVAGEITPKCLASRFTEPAARLAAPPLAAFSWIATPLRWAVLQIVNRVLTLLGAPPRVRRNVLMEGEFLDWVEAGHAGGALDAAERTYIQNVFEFHDSTAGEVAIPRTEMVCWEADLPLTEVMERVRNAPHSRIPIYGGDRDNIIGILYVKDFLRHLRRASGPGERLAPAMLRRPIYVPSGMKLDALFRVFRQRRTHLAVVLDEFGGVEGLVTMKDLLEEIFGKLQDEFDQATEDWIQAEAEDAYLCRARTTLEDFSAATGWKVPGHPEAQTLGGVVFTLLGRIPRAGERVAWGGVELMVVEARPTGAVRIRAKRLEEGA
ncbi:MAG: HlyC/CorC family transporter [Candidatus Tectomicrobia bacterium]|uniref:HlyC/CorC family transporter n=1 Tax=Tectimicrobiota bacterium TaxID=2528274 RepID=A0A932HZC9_UNCTE|nr:HlyC/CorC family transporter [Candidatus Tectomicrobia bacterium]